MNHHHHHGAGDDPAVMADLLDLDGEVLASYLADATGWVAELAARPVGEADT